MLNKGFHYINNAYRDMAYQDKVHKFLTKNSIKHLVRNLSESFTKWKLLALSKVKSSEDVID
jgi:hypothetical protein